MSEILHILPEFLEENSKLVKNCLKMRQGESQKCLREKND